MSARRIKVKICGMRDPLNIGNVSSLAPDYMGFIFYKKSPRYVGPDFVLPEGFDNKIAKVGVFVNADIAEMQRQVERLKLDVLQLHGDESVDVLKQLKQNDIKLWKVFSVDDGFDFGKVAPFKDYVDCFLFDTKGKYYGGNAETFNWRILERYDQEIPFVLSGGLNEENVRSISTLLDMNLHALDLNSGVEVSPGLKDVEKIERIKSSIIELEKIK